MYCNNCGHRNPVGANFCSTCGAALQPEDHSETTVSFVLDAESEGEEEFLIPIEELEEGTGIIVVRRGPEAGTKFFIGTDVTTCGRDPESGIFLDDVTVSRRHAEIWRKDNAFRIADVGSLNGTFVNRSRVEESALSNGDEIQIGKFKLVFFTGGAPAA